MDHKEVIKQICDFMGEDLDAPACREVAEHIKICPSCQVQLDTVKRTVTICRDLTQTRKMPDDVSHRLFKVLNLDELRKKD